MKRHTVPWRKLAVLIPAALLGAAGGYFFMWALDPYGMTVLLPSLACLILSFWLQAILHEGGHLVCGLLSGYRFLSFRVGSFTLLRQNGRLVLRRFYLPGTGRQCLQTGTRSPSGFIILGAAWPICFPPWRRP